MINDVKNKRERDEESFNLFINVGIYVSCLIMLMFGLIVFFLVEIFFLPLQEHIWIPSIIICSFIFLFSILTNFILLGNIILNNSFFHNNKNDKKYFSAAIILFFINNLICLFMFKKLLKNCNLEVINE